MTTMTLADAITRHGVDVDEHLDRALSIPVLRGMQRQGDVLIVPSRREGGGTGVPAAGVPVVRGEAGGNTHLLLADGAVLWRPVEGRGDAALVIGVITVPTDATAWLAHPEHGFLGVGQGVYEARRQREQADEIRLVQD